MLLIAGTAFGSYLLDRYEAEPSNMWVSLCATATDGRIRSTNIPDLRDELYAPKVGGKKTVSYPERWRGHPITMTLGKARCSPLPSKRRRAHLRPARGRRSTKGDELLVRSCGRTIRIDRGNGGLGGGVNLTSSSP